MRFKVLVSFLIMLLVGCTAAFASHIVGGEVTYTCNGNYLYTVNVTIYEDCLNGDPEAIAEDDPAYLSFYTVSGVPYDGFLGNGLPGNAHTDSVHGQPAITVPTNFSNSCITNPPATCLRKKTFTKQYYFPPSTTGYLIVYQRCCRNASILNILNPSQVGATYYCEIPPTSVAACNNSAVFKNYPPQIICINNPLVYDNSATDADGDSLSYEFCDTYEGGSDNDAKPLPPPPPYDTVSYRAPFSDGNPMGGYPEIQIDPATGLISGTPNLLGRFVVTVCCHEWRNHIMINTLKREFQFVVTNCTKSVVADIPQYSTDFNTYIVDCRDYTVHFVNTSVGGFSYHWDFGTGNPADTSSEFEPTFTYTDTGTYIVSLFVNPGSTCPDSISRFVKVYPAFNTDYSFTGIQCPDSSIVFTDLTTSTFKPVIDYEWNFGDGTGDTAENPVHNYAQGGIYNVTLTAKNVRGCRDTSLKQVVIQKFIPFAGNDTILVRGESITYDATGGTQYTWTPSSHLSDTNIYNPVGYYPDTGHFAYYVHIVSNFGCSGDDSINVWVVNQSSYFVPTGFTPNNDGKNDILRPIAVGYRSIIYFRVFNRWGQQVYNSHDFDAGWDGTFNGKKQEIGTYFWELKLINRFGNVENGKGDVTLIR